MFLWCRGRPGRQGLKNLGCYGKACTVSGNPALSSAGCLVVVSARDIAFMLGYAPDSNPLRRILADPTFPHSLSLVEGGSRKYLRKEVEAWVQQKFADDRDTILRAHRAA